MSHPEVVFIIGLLLPESLAHSIAQFAQKIHEREPANYTLNAESTPHLSLLHFKDSPDNAEKIWTQIASITVENLKFQLAGFTFSQTPGGFWLALRVFERSPLIRLQTQLIEKLGPRSYRNGIGELFDPHITLAGWSELKKCPELETDSHMMSAQIRNPSLGLAIAGPMGQFQKQIFSKKLFLTL